MHELVDAVQELCEDRRDFFGIPGSEEPTPISEFVAEGQPFLLNQSLRKQL